MKLSLLAFAIATTFPSGEDAYHCPEESRAQQCVEDSVCPILRLPPAFPESCLIGKAVEERIVVRLAVLSSGLVESGTVVESTNPCFDRAALKNLCRYRYPAAETNRVEIETIIFKYEDRPEEERHA